MAGLYTGAIGLWGGLPGLISSTTLSTPPSLLANVGGIAATGADLALWFDENQAYKSSGGGIVTPDSILTYTAPSPKLVYGSDGVLRYAPHNLLTGSQTIGGSGWLNAGTPPLSVTQNSTVAPDGTTTAALISLNTSGGTYQFNAIGTGVPFIAAIWLKRVSTSGTVRFTHPSAPGFGTMTVDLALLSDGWERITPTHSAVSAYTPYVGAGNQGGMYIESTGGTTKSFYAWGAQNNLSRTVLTYVPTTTAAVYSLPRDDNPTTGAALGVLVEEARTNLVTYSQAADNAAWSKVALLTVNGNNAGAPDGTATFCNLTPNTTNTQHFISTAAFTPAASALCISAYFKANGYRWVRFAHSTGIISFDTLTGTIGATSGVTSSGVQSIGNGVYRAFFVYTASAASNSVFISVNNADNTGTTSFAGDGTSGVLVWGMQAEQGAFATSYIPTVASQVTRAADNIYILTSDFPYNTLEGSVALDVPADVRGTGNVFSLSDGTSAIRPLVLFNSTTTSIWLFSSGSPGSMDLIGAISAAAYKVSAAYKLNDYAASLNGASPITDTSAVVQTPNRLNVGNAGNGLVQINGHIKRLAYYASRKTNAELVVLST